MIFCVDPDPDERAATRVALADAGFAVDEHPSLAAARDALSDDDVDCVVTEYDLPDGTGLDLIDAVRETTPDAACILYTATPLDDVDTESFGGAVAEYLRKGSPDAGEELVALVEHSLSFLSQTAYPVPRDEGARLAALARYTDRPAALDDALDRLTTVAVDLFDVDAAAIGLVDAHHEEFVACRGASPDSIPREDTICTYALLDDDVTVVEDVRDDPRFESNDGFDVVTLRFYAGAPMVTPDGQTIGMFCLHGSEPRTFDERDRELLAALAEEAMDQFELRRRLGERGEDPATVATEGGGDGE